MDQGTSGNDTSNRRLPSFPIYSQHIKWSGNLVVVEHERLHRNNQLSAQIVQLGRSAARFEADQSKLNSVFLFSLILT